MNEGFVVVDGAGGFIGGHVAEALIRSGYRVRATDRKGVDLRPLADQGAETVASDLLDPSSLRLLFQGAKAAVHCAAAFDLALPYKVLYDLNALGTANVVSSCLSAGVERLIHFSTGGVYGPPRYWPTDEKHPFNPLDAYSKSKAAAEAEIAEGVRRGLKVTIFRPTAVYGPRSTYIAGMFYSLPALLNHWNFAIPRIAGGPPMNLIHLEDVTGAVLFALQNENTAGEAYNLGDESIVSVGEFFDIVCDIFKIRTRGKVWAPAPLLSAIGRMGLMLPSWLMLDPIERWLKKQWDNVVMKNDLDPVLKPQLARDALGFLIGPHAYTSKKLRDAGYKFRHPIFADSFPAVVEWYRERNWIP